MAGETYTELSDALFSVDSPTRSTDGKALRDNPIAIASGAAGAPRIEDAALDTGAATSTRAPWVGKGMAGLGYGELGTYTIAVTQSGVAVGGKVSGSLLGYFVYDGENETFESYNLSGTWQNMGGGLYLRIL